MTIDKEGTIKIFKNKILSDLLLIWFFSEYDVYHTNNCDYNFLSKDSGYVDNDAMRKDWVFGKHGYVNDFSKYYNFYERVIEYATVKDNPSSLRQKLNILHIMNECDFQPNNPIHITLLGDTNEKILDLDDQETWKYFEIVVHPGHTRVLASLFMKRNIKSGLFYVQKKLNVKVKGNSVKKINKENLEFLFIDKFGKNDKNNNTLKIFGHWYGNDTKIKDLAKESHQTDNEKFQVLKIYDYFYIKKNELISRSIGNSYIYNTFLYAHQYFKILFNNDIKVYSHKKDFIEDLLNNNMTKLLGLELKYYPSIKNSYQISILSTLYKTDALINDIDRAYDILDKNEKFVFNELKKFFKNFNELGKSELDERTFLFKHDIWKEIKKDNYIFKKITNKNDYKGFAVYIDNTKIQKYIKFEKTLPELLYLANPTVSIVRAEDNRFAIINCEHEYWKTNENFQEIIIQKSFYEN